MVASKPGSINRYYRWLFKTCYQIPALWTYINKHLGIALPYYYGFRRNGKLDYTSDYLPVFIPCCLDSVLYQRYSVPSPIHKEKVATPKHIAYNQSLI